MADIQSAKATCLDQSDDRRDTGLGDTVARAIAWVQRKVGIHEGPVSDDCGCKERQATLNRIVPYSGGRGKALGNVR